MFDNFNLEKINLTKYLFLTGKGGVGKTSTACAFAVNLADLGKKILLISTDPASNLQDVFNTELDGKGVAILGVPGLFVANLDPIEAARQYKESVVAPYRGKLPDSVISNMEEQLSGSCTAEIAAFDQFSNFITNNNIENEYDHIIFDTAPTGHTLRMLQLPSAWSDFISESTHGASCLGQLAGLEDKKEIYKNAVKNLADKNKTTLILISRPDETPMIEAERSSLELSELGINNQLLIINGVISNSDDEISREIFNKQQSVMKNMPYGLVKTTTYILPLRSYNILGLENIRAFFYKEINNQNPKLSKLDKTKKIHDLIDDIYNSNKKLIFTMGKGGVGKTSVASAIAFALAEKGVKVHLTSTDPANHIKFVAEKSKNIKVSEINEKEELAKYQKEVLDKARETMNESDIAYIEEDLRSPCTQEIAVFRAFADVVEKAKNEVVIIDTAPSGHTLLLLDATQSYHKEVERTKGETSDAIKNLLPMLRDETKTEIIIVTLPEATPVYEANRLKEDLKRAGINNKWWVINQSFAKIETTNSLLSSRAEAENQWIEKVIDISRGNVCVIPWLKNATVRNIVT